MLDIKKKFLISFGILLLLIGAVGGVMIQQVGKLGRLSTSYCGKTIRVSCSASR